MAILPKIDIVERKMGIPIEKERLINGFFPHTENERKLAIEINKIIAYLNKK